MGEAPVTLSLELDPSSEPISGSLKDAQGERRSFQGWMELALALEALMQAARSSRSERAQAPASDTGGDRAP